jgi:hypothetical protein
MREGEAGYNTKQATMEVGAYIKEHGKVGRSASSIRVRSYSALSRILFRVYGKLASIKALEL